MAVWESSADTRVYDVMWYHTRILCLEQRSLVRIQQLAPLARTLCRAIIALRNNDHQPSRGVTQFFLSVSGVARILPGGGPNFFREGSTLGIFNKNRTLVLEPRLR